MTILESIYYKKLTTIKIKIDYKNKNRKLRSNDRKKYDFTRKIKRKKARIPV